MRDKIRSIRAVVTPTIRASWVEGPLLEDDTDATWVFRDPATVGDEVGIWTNVGIVVGVAERRFGLAVEIALGSVVGVPVGADDTNAGDLVLGSAVGFEVKVAVGIDVNVAVGVVVRSAVGVAVGVPVGAAVGVDDTNAGDLVLGLAVGIEVRVAVGIDVGIAVGLAVGEGVEHK